MARSSTTTVPRAVPIALGTIAAVALVACIILLIIWQRRRSVLQKRINNTIVVPNNPQKYNQLLPAYPTLGTATTPEMSSTYLPPPHAPSRSRSRSPSPYSFRSASPYQSLDTDIEQAVPTSYTPLATEAPPFAPVLTREDPITLRNVSSSTPAVNRGSFGLKVKTGEATVFNELPGEKTPKRPVELSASKSIHTPAERLERPQLPYPMEDGEIGIARGSGVYGLPNEDREEERDRMGETYTYKPYAGRGSRKVRRTGTMRTERDPREEYEESLYSDDEVDERDAAIPPLFSRGRRDVDDDRTRW